jgi:hypothetical protein
LKNWSGIKLDSAANLQKKFGKHHEVFSIETNMRIQYIIFNTKAGER